MQKFLKHCSFVENNEEDDELEILSFDDDYNEFVGVLIGDGWYE